MPSKLLNATLYGGGFSPAVATWYGSPTGSGSGGACGLGNDVIYAPYNGMIAAGNGNLFRSGGGCGTCFMVKCTNNPACSGFPIHVTITDECPGLCNNDRIHFDLSGKAFGYLAKAGREEELRKAGRIDIQYTSVQCHYNSKIAVKIDSGSNRYYVAMSVENVNGDGEINRIDILAQGWKSWASMQRKWGETWKFDVPSGATGPFSIKFTDLAVAYNLIPRNWAPGQKYYSNTNFP
ncbi:putative expansin-B14 [Salvia hispanica]|uniref:putative expansin-B14 n=1 Tax=Salvia hispanica TaxID=49212 RepID=UPI002009A7C8|nr:putative expansin-B14 [Salvia hispanica]